MNLCHADWFLACLPLFRLFEHPFAMRKRADALTSALYASAQKPALLISSTGVLPYSSMPGQLDAGFFLWSAHDPVSASRLYFFLCTPCIRCQIFLVLLINCNIFTEKKLE